MIPDIGLIALTIAFGKAVYATFYSAYGGIYQKPAWVASARNAVRKIAYA